MFLGGDRMTIMPQWKICPRCHKRYDWNPDVGVMGCPYCMEKDMKQLKKVESLFVKKNKDEKDDSEYNN